MPKLEFPKGFLWGAATAAHQVEGDNHNDWSEWERLNADRLARESEHAFRHNPHWKKFRAEATNPKNYLSGTACEHYTRYEEDFTLAQLLHHNAHRFSIEWSRIEPEEGKYSDIQIEHYRAVIAALRARHIEPFVTLWHWTLPSWLAAQGGVLAKDFPKYFERYVEKMAVALDADVKFWITLNEPEVQSAHAYLKGLWPPQKKCLLSFLRALYALMQAHKRAYAMIKRVSPSAQVGIAKHQVAFVAARPTLVNRLLRSLSSWFWNKHLLSHIRHEMDFIGLNHYNRNVIKNGFGKNPNKVQTDIGWEYSPESLYQALVEVKSFGLPIYITENGLADASDKLRERFIPAALAAVHRAITDGTDVRGYFYWSLLDNFEWDKGFWPRFGLVAVDRTTQTRTVRPSAREYAKVCKTNTLEI